MKTHVDHLLAAYVERQLTQHDAAAVYRHIQGCPRCRMNLIAHESMSQRLRSALTENFDPSARRIDRWWHRFRMAPAATAPLPRRPLWLPVTISVIILMFPLSLNAGFSQDGRPLAMTAPIVVTESQAYAPSMSPGHQEESKSDALLNDVATAPPTLYLTVVPAQPAPDQP